MLFPVLPFTKTFYEECTTFPRAFGIYSFSVLLNILITLYVMQFYARGYIVRAYSNYKTLNTTNMETLIALGSLSAFSLSLFFIVRYSILGADHLHMAIMDINDALTSASVIVLTVTIGKHFEGRAKRQIERITDEIFPESVLFQNMKVQFAEMRNRQLKVVN
jgi:cation transport ATPase